MCKKSKGLCSKRGGKRAEKWNKNRLMMELVSRWGSPLTSEAPHSLAYPSRVNRRGDTTDLSLPAKSSSGEPTALPPSHPFTLSFFLPDCKEAKLKLCSCDDWQPLCYVYGGGARTDKPPARCLEPSAFFLSTVCTQLPCLPGVYIAGLSVGAVWLLSQKPDIWTAQAI